MSNYKILARILSCNTSTKKQCIVDLNTQDVQGRTLLMIIFEDYTTNIVSSKLMALDSLCKKNVIIKSPVDLNIVNRKGQTWFDYVHNAYIYYPYMFNNVVTKLLKKIGLRCPIRLVNPNTGLCLLEYPSLFNNTCPIEAFLNINREMFEPINFNTEISGSSLIQKLLMMFSDDIKTENICDFFTFMDLHISESIDVKRVLNAYISIYKNPNEQVIDLLLLRGSRISMYAPVLSNSKNDPWCRRIQRWINKFTSENVGGLVSLKVVCIRHIYDNMIKIPDYYPYLLYQFPDVNTLISQKR